MKWGVAFRNIRHWFRYDLKEIVFPASLPNPPGYLTKPKPRKLAFKEYISILKTAATLHAKSFTRTGLTKEDWKKIGLDEDDDPREADNKEPTPSNSIEELALAARLGAEHLKPTLQRLYMTRASAYRDALKSFVVGYQEGIAEVMADKAKSKSDVGAKGAAHAQSPRPSTSENPKKDKVPL